jgi:hypothetical protein
MIGGLSKIYERDPKGALRKRDSSGLRSVSQTPDLFEAESAGECASRDTAVSDKVNRLDNLDDNS